MCISKLARPPTSTLFPYTTLFRSGRERSRLKDFVPSQKGELMFDQNKLKRSIFCLALTFLFCASAFAQQQGDRQHKTSEQDRKSTRLNSSHITISYAVFCLKKKKS